jgi:16S rRNA (cytosine967-C5)-methyltransferase
LPTCLARELARWPEILKSNGGWRPEDLQDLQAKQLAILQSAMKHVAAGGRLAYSTCSLEQEENEEVVEETLAGNSSFRVLDCVHELERLRSEGELSWNDVKSLTNGHYLRTIPGVHPCDGFFATVLERI